MKFAKTSGPWTCTSAKHGLLTCLELLERADVPCLYRTKRLERLQEELREEWQQCVWPAYAPANLRGQKIDQILLRDEARYGTFPNIDPHMS